MLAWLLAVPCLIAAMQPSAVGNPIGLAGMPHDLLQAILSHLEVFGVHGASPVSIRLKKASRQVLQWKGLSLLHLASVQI